MRRSPLRSASILIAAAFVAAGLSGTPVSAAVTVTATPGTVQLAPGERAQVVLTVSSDEATITDVTIEPVAATGLSVEPASPEGWSRIEAGGSRTRVLTVTRGGDRAGLGTLPIRASWTVPRASDGLAGSPEVRGSMVASVTVGDSETRLMSGIASLQVKSAVQLIEDRRGAGMAYVVVTNLTSHPLEVVGVRCYAPYFLTVRGGRGSRPRAGFWLVDRVRRYFDDHEEADDPSVEEDETEGPGACQAGLELPTVPPGSSRALPFQITASVVEPGNHTVAWELEMAWTRGGDRQDGVLVVDKDFTVGVLGESTLLTLVAWPSVLVLPGALMLLTFLTLRKRVWPKTASDLSSASDATKAEFWLIAVVLSFLTAMLYPWLTGKLGDPRDFVVVHGLDDIVNLWLGAVGVAVLAWALWWLGAQIEKWIEAAVEWNRQRQLPAPGEDPITLLERKKTHAHLEAERIDVTVGDRTSSALILFDAGEDGVWIGPRVVVRARDAGAKQRFEGLRDDPGTEPRALAAALREALKSGEVVEVAWQDDGEIVRVPDDAVLGRSGARNRLVTIEEAAGG